MQNPLPMAGEAELNAENINLRHYWHVVLERRWLVVTAFISVFLLCLVYLYKAPKIYAAVARIQIDKESENTLNLREMLSVSGIDQDYLQTQYKNLMNRTLVESVFKQLHLEKDNRYNKSVDPIKSLSEDITITPIRLSRLVDVRVEHTDPEIAAKIANTLTEQFIGENLVHKQKKVLDMVFYLRAQTKSLQQDVDNADQALQVYRERVKIASLDAERNPIYQAWSEASLAYAKAQTELKAQQAIVEKLDDYTKTGGPLETFPIIASDEQVAKTQIQLLSLKNELAGLQKRYKDKHPKMIEIRARINDAEAAVLSAAKQVADTLRTRSVVAKANEKYQLEALQEWERKQMDWNEAKRGYDKLFRDAETAKALYNQVLGRSREIELIGNDKANNISVRDAAFVPFKPVKPRVVLTLFLGVFGGLGIAIGLAFFVNYLDDSIKSQDDVETYLRLAFLGYVPNIKSNSVVERDLQSHFHAQSNAAEAFRTIRAAISLTHKAEQLHILTVTSTIPSEGKSLVASNLAIVLAQTGLKTLLVDADLRRPSVHKAFQLHSPVGLAAYLAEGAHSVDELVHTTEVPNLDVVCCGAAPQNPSELIGSKRMVQFLQEARKKYDRVLLDCPPVSAVSDPLVISAIADGIIFVTKFNKIRREHARKTIQRIQDAGIHVCGTVLNDIDFEGRDSYYYSYYYYQNRYYSSHYRTAQQKTALQGKEEAKKG